MRKFREFDSTALKAFYYAATTENFTEAAFKANMTQSGISQHVSKIEATLGAELFLRIGRGVRLNQTGLKFKSFVETFLDEFDAVVESIGEQQASVSGPVAYAMPASCRFTPHFPLLLEKRKQFPLIDLRVQFCPTEMVIEGLLNGSIDFGFVTKNTQHPDLEFRAFAEEEYVLAGTTDFNLRKIDLKKLKEMPFIKYPGVDVLFESWLKAYFSRARTLSLSSLKIRGDVNSLNGAILMAQHGLGVTIFPRHCIEKDLKTRHLVEFTAASKAPTNKIFMAQLKARQQPRRVATVMNAFWQMVQE